MFDFHMHSKVSYDGKSDALQMVQAAVAAGLKEICFTDHLDYDPMGRETNIAFSTEDYNRTYDNLEHSQLVIRRGMEFGMLPDNVQVFREDIKRRPFDFVLGSIHFADGIDIYYPEFWDGKDHAKAEEQVLLNTLACVKAHDDFDVLAHLTYMSKAHANPDKRIIPYADHRELFDEILQTLVSKGKGLEINTSGVDVCGATLPHEPYLRRFKELGGEIVTVGSDAHTAARVGQYCHETCILVREIFGYVCTFAERKPIFHK